MIEGFGKQELRAFVLGAVAPQTQLVTDDWPAYQDLPGVRHNAITLGPMAAHIAVPGTSLRRYLRLLTLVEPTAALLAAGFGTSGIPFPSLAKLSSIALLWPISSAAGCQSCPQQRRDLSQNRQQVRYHSDRRNGAYRLAQMTRIGRANEGDGDCWLGKAERQSRSHRRLARFKIAGEDLPGDHYRATFGGALQLNE